MSTPAVSPPSPSDLLDVAEAALSSTFGTEFDLWAMGEGCLRPVGPRAQAATGEGRERALALEDQVQSRLMAAADPLVFKQDDDRFLVGLPLGGSRGETLLATATLEACPEAILLKTANLLLSDLDLRRELQQCRHDLDACAIQIGNDFEELTFLRRLAESLDLSDLSQGLWDLAKIVLPQLARMIRTELLALVAAGTIQQEATEAAAGDVAGDAEVWVGDQQELGRVCRRLVQRFHESARRRPFVQSGFSGHAEAADFPGVRAFIITSLRKGERVLGWLVAINQRAPARLPGTHEHWPAGHTGFGSIEAGLMSSVATILATHACNVEMLREKESVLVKVVRAMVSAVDAKDPYTCGHSERVALVGRLLGQRLRLGEEECERLYLAGLLHDLGKLGVPDAVLSKPGPLTNEEFNEIRPHPERGWAILHDLQQLEFLIPGILHHHERYDGGGYPDGLAGEEIPLPARILAVADSYDAMASDRPYRKGMPQEKVAAILHAGAGKQWDPRVVEAFLNAMPEIRAQWEGYRPQTPVRSRARPAGPRAEGASTAAGQP